MTKERAVIERRKENMPGYAFFERRQSKDAAQMTSEILNDEQAATVGRELARHLQNGATISKHEDKCLVPLKDGTIFGGLLFKYPSGPCAEQRDAAPAPAALTRERIEELRLRVSAWVPDRIVVREVPKWHDDINALCDLALLSLRPQETVAILGPVQQAPDGTLFRLGSANGANESQETSELVNELRDIAKDGHACQVREALWDSITALAAAEQEVARLKEQLAVAEKSGDSVAEDASECIVALAASEQDARRYRWIRHAFNQPDPDDDPESAWAVAWNTLELGQVDGRIAAQLDEAIDAALSKQEGKT